MKQRVFPAYRGDAGIVFVPLLSPMEAAMLPAKERQPLGALHHAKNAWQPYKNEKEKAQRAKIWVR